MSNQKIIITPLGTVSPYCKGNQNCPGFLVNYNNQKILLDCGNGVTRLLNFPDDLKNLSVIISHLHKDHFGDLSGIQYAAYVFNNYNLLSKKVDVYLPKTEYLDNKSAIIKMKESFTNYFDITEKTKYLIDNLKISFKNNPGHNIESYAIKLENDLFKIVYTGDIGREDTKELIKFCENADLLICESSFIESHNATSSQHYHAYEAANLAKKANVKQLMITHFWPETPKENYLKEAKEIFKNTIIAEEGEKVVLNK